ncbi:MAG: enoyl-CoA hydratase/isomerase family protein [Myxococcales bacterium]|nr:enoyl-CoA hydratase/isomerase family protein [Myxococcales bacterium]
MFRDVQLSVQGDVALIQFSRPAEGNAIRGPMFDELRKIVLQLSDRPPPFVVLCGEGSDFCTGLDLSPSDPLRTMLEPMLANRDAYRVQELVARLRGTLDSLTRLPCPIVAAIEGRCHGAGLEVALTADLRIASEDATFALNGMRRGLLTGMGGLVNLSLLLGPARAQDIALTGRLLSAEDARGMGLVSQLCPSGSARATALDLVAELRSTPDAARLQTVLAARGIRQRMAAELVEQESQCAARTWIAGDWRSSR